MARHILNAGRAQFQTGSELSHMSDLTSILPINHLYYISCIHHLNLHHFIIETRMSTRKKSGLPAGVGKATVLTSPLYGYVVFNAQ
jgi:hypothetical protein